MVVFLLVVVEGVACRGALLAHVAREHGNHVICLNMAGHVVASGN
jgi:type III secretory pathway lipoprotein EscJ